MSTNTKKKGRDALNTRAAKVGGYSFVMAVVVLAILIAVNIAVDSLPSTWTHYDISAVRLYSLTSASKVVAQNLDQDVTIYWITQSDEEDTVVEKLLDVYDAMSDHITVEKTNPDIYPTFAAQYTDETVYNNSLVVECGDRYRYIGYADIYEADYTNYYYSGSAAYSFDGESQITSAINYVTTEDLPKLYVISGHGESALSESFQEALEKQNVEIENLSLLTADEIPEDADGLIIYAPSSDISEDEATMLSDYAKAGGKLLLMSGLQDEETLDNLHSIFEDYGITTQDGIIVEGSRDHYAFTYPYILMPELGDSDITAELSENNSNVIVPISQGLVLGSHSSDVTLTELLTTSDEAFAKLAGYAIETYEKEEGDVDGPFTVAVSVEDGDGGSLIWISSDYVMDDTYDSYSSGANTDFVMNCVSWLVGETDSISIRSKSLDYSYLTISSTQANRIKWCLLCFLPLLFLVCGIEDTVSRRKKQ